MANIGGLSGTTSNSLNGIRGYGGLASGLDRDSLIESMTYGTTSKIDKQKIKKTQLQWQQNAIRNITDKMIAFADKYTATYTSSTNLFSSAFWGRADITALGVNNKYISVSGTANSSSSVSIAGIKQLAEKAKWSSKNSVSDKTLETGTIDTSAEQKLDTLQGKTLTFEYGNKDYTITLSGKDENGQPYKFSTVEDVKNSINAILKAESKDGGMPEGAVVAELKDGKLVFKTNETSGNNIKLKDGTALETLGFKEAGKDFEAKEITQQGISSDKALTENELIQKVSFVDKIAGKELTFSYNGVSKTFTLPDKETLSKATDVMAEVKNSLQKQFDDAFGSGRVEVKWENNKLEFKTTKPGGGEDQSSTLTLVNGSAELIGEGGALNISAGESNRLNLNAKLGEAGFQNGVTIGDTPVKVKINGTEIEITKDDTVYSLMEKINSQTDVTVSYQEAADKFTITAKADGASGKIKIEDASGTLEKIFGQGIPTDDSCVGKDAIIGVKYGDSDEVVEIIRGSNSFELDGMTIGLNGTFGYDEKGTYIEGTEEITFDAKVDTDKIVEAVKTMVDEYNEIIELVNKELSTRPDREYQPLTSEQKKELTEEEIKLYEEKAKEGILFGDSDLRALSSELRFAINPADLAEMEKIGLSVSSSYSDNGKLSFDEKKFKAALEADPENVQELFTKKKSDGNATGTDGLATNLKNTMSKFANNVGTMGILIEKAGSTKAPRSITDNALYDQMEQIDKKIKDLEVRLKMEQDRYIKQFTTLETVIAQMNSQSGWLSQFGGGY